MQHPLFYSARAKDPQELTVISAPSPDSSKATVAFSKKPSEHYLLEWNETKDAIKCTNPDKTVQTFRRRALP